MNLPRLNLVRACRVASVIAIAALAMVIPVRAAQEADGSHPAHIHAGNCETLGEVVAPLSDVAAMESSGAVGTASALPVKVSVSRVDMPLQSIIDGEHAVNVHKSADEIDDYIACGAVGGVLSNDGLVIGLGELNNSGHSGVAVLAADGDATDVTVYLLEGSGTAGATAAQEAAPAAADGEAVAIKDFAFNPPTIEVPVGGSVTWSNEDAVPHTATAIDKAILQSGMIAAGASFTQQFDTAGSYDYYCEFHPNMKGSIVVK